MNRNEANRDPRNHDMPHEHTLDELGLDVEDLSASIQTEIRRFDAQYEKALTDGFMDDNEENILITLSYKISQMIKKEFPDTNKGNSYLAIGIIAGIGLTIAGIIGINKLNQT